FCRGAECVRRCFRSMRASLSLQLALFQKQHAEIEATVEGRSRAFNAYEARYRALTRRMKRVLSSEDVLSRVREADVVYVGDYHTLPAAQLEYLRLVKACQRRVVMALEFFEARHQAGVDAYLAGALSLRGLEKTTGHGALFSHVVPILKHARRHRLEIVAIDRRASGPRSLRVRDDFAAERIVAALKAADKPQVLVLVGQYHIAAPHLPYSVSRLSSARSLTVFQNCEALYWTLAKQGRIGATAAVELTDRELCLFNTSPVMAQQSYLTYLEQQRGEESEDDASARFREVVGLLGKMARVNVCLDDAPFSGSASLNHVAEEAARWVRRCCVGSSDPKRSPARIDHGIQTFYASCLEAALGFLGSRLINPHRPSPDCAALFLEGSASERRVAAFALAHQAMDEAVAPKLLPARPATLRNDVARTLGYLLGDMLHQAYEAEELSDLRALFHTRFTDPRATYFAWRSRLSERRADSKFDSVALVANPRRERDSDLQPQRAQR
ncbi:MAG: ChaN family lipoprotein, partial [Myxococcaceae bacterium]